MDHFGPGREWRLQLGFLDLLAASWEEIELILLIRLGHCQFVCVKSKRNGLALERCCKDSVKLTGCFLAVLFA